MTANSLLGAIKLDCFQQEQKKAEILKEEREEGRIPLTKTLAENPLEKISRGWD